MAKIRKLESFKRRLMWTQLWLAGPALLGAGWVLWSFHSLSAALQWNWPGWLGVGLFVMVSLLGWALDFWLKRRVRCPDCGARLPYARTMAGEPIQYFCEKCDTVWDTGMKEPEAGAGE